ncbi:uncharacterized protein LOC117604254 [Osmia lignaria lignaria]|uniref:uncharacterized protein LOC117604254 n=1 Tax=Osmia lignaria lignaria TaxID=1437193 RepID=UPI00402B2008
MLILLVALTVAVLDTAVGAEYQFHLRSRRGVEAGHNPQEFRQSRYKNPNVQNTRTEDARPSSYKSGKINPEESVNAPYSNLRQSESQSNESPYLDKLFTMTASYKVASDKIKPSKQISTHNQNPGTEGAYGAFPSFNVQVPLYKSSGLQSHAPIFQNNPYSDATNQKKQSLPVLQLRNTQDLSTYLTNFQNQPYLLNPTDYRFSFVGKAPKVNNVQLGSPFLSPLSSFQSQVVPISTAVNSPQFPQYKGASIQVYPTVGGFPATAYQPLQTQPQLHFQQDTMQRVQPVGAVPQSAPAQEIRADVEIIDKHPTTPPLKRDDEDGDEEGGYTPDEKEYRPNSETDEEYDDKPDRYFKAPRTEGNFKPSMTFPFKQYDEKFGKYSDQNHEEEVDYDSNEKILSNKYQSKDTLSKPYYSRQEEEDDDGRGSYEKQKAEESSENTYRPKYFDKNFDEEFGAPYRKESPPQKPRRDESEDPSSEENRTSLKYYKAPHYYQDNEGHSSDNLGRVSKVIHEEGFGYRISKGNKRF